VKIAVITSTYNTPSAWLDQCHESVRNQTIPCTHILVNDAGERADVERHADTAQIIHIPGPHGDGGNACRAMGGMLAICDGYDAITYLDSDNWYSPNHLETVMEMASGSGASVISCSRLIYTPMGDLMGECYETDPDHFIDTSCMLFMKPAFGAATYWACIPDPIKQQADRWVWQRIVQDSRLLRAHTHKPTVHFRSVYKCHYKHFGWLLPEYATK